MDDRATIHDVLGEMAQYTHGGDAGDKPDTSNAEYLRALKRTHESGAAAGTGAASAAPTATSGSAQNSYPHPDRRRNPRYKCEGSAEFRSEGSDVHTWASVIELSRSGCYVEMQATYPQDTAVSMVIEVKGIRVQVKGMVRITYPFLGMGIAFTEIADADRAQLDELLQRLASGVPLPVSPPTPKPATASALDLSTANAGRTLGAVAKFFQSHFTLTRDQFTELIERDGPEPRH